MRIALSSVCMLFVFAVGCTRSPAAPHALVYADHEEALPAGADPVALSGGHALRASLDGRVTLIAARLPAHAALGETVHATVWLRVDDDVPGAPQAFVHAQIPGAELSQANADHRVLGGKRAPSVWRRGEVLVDTFDVVVPPALAGDALSIWYGLYEGKRRLAVTPASAQDGKDRVELGRVHVDGGPPVDVTGTAVRRQGAIAIDGKLDEADWARAPHLGPFVSYDGKSAVVAATFAQMLWDDDNVYVAFTAVDRDVHTPYTKHDDKLYESEAVEIFIDADGDRDEYVELQAAPNDVHFDAAFRGGRRKNMDTSYDVPFETATIVRGTLNDNRDVDEGFVSEWRIPIAAIRDVPGKPTVDDRWKINLFRLDRVREGERVVRSEATAWSSPLSGDFHNLDRMATLVFGP